jgi:predicted nuclease of predicted toxin-antitoxin system
MKFLIDMNLSPAWVGILKANDYESVHWIEIGPKNASDEIIFEWARDNGYAIVTLDVDFGTLLAHSHTKRPSVIQIRREDVDPLHLQAPLFKILSEYSTAIETGALIVLDEKKVRVRMLPF